MCDHVTAGDEQLAIERDADRLPGARVTRPGTVVAGPRLDAAHDRELARRRHCDFVTDRDKAALNAARHDAAIVEPIDGLHWQPQRQRGGGPRRREAVEGLDHGWSPVPADRGGSLDDAVAVARRNRDDRRGLEPQVGEMRRNFGLDFAEAAVLIADTVHLVDDYDHLPDAEQVQQI